MNEIEAKVRKWVEKAEKDLKVAKREIEEKEPVLEAVLFHSQQAVEKFLKAFLTLHQMKFGRSHDISYLIMLCSKIDEEFKKLFELNVDRLYPKGIEVRYPEIDVEVTKEEAEEAIEIAEKVKEFVLKKLNRL